MFRDAANLEASYTRPATYIWKETVKLDTLVPQLQQGRQAVNSSKEADFPEEVVWYQK